MRTLATVLVLVAGAGFAGCGAADRSAPDATGEDPVVERLSAGGDSSSPSRSEDPGRLPTSTELAKSNLKRSDLMEMLEAPALDSFDRGPEGPTAPQP